MASVLSIHLLQPNMGAAVQYNVAITGEQTGQPGVTAIVVRYQGLGWCVLADHPWNPGVSVTNGAEKYAEAVCQTLDCDITDIAWFELDSMGNFDELHLMGARVRFAPLLEEGIAPRSLDALRARVARLGPGLPADAEELIRSCSARFNC